MMQIGCLAGQCRVFSSAARLKLAQPLSIPRLDATTSRPPSPTEAGSASRTDADADHARPSAGRIRVPTTSEFKEQQVVTLTLRTRAVDIEAPTYGISKASFPYVWLRDACTGPQSVDPSTRQKLFKTEDISADLKPWDCRINEQTHELTIDWDRPLKGKAPNAKESSKFPLDFLRFHASHDTWRARHGENQLTAKQTWDATSLSRSLLTVPYEKLSSKKVRLSAIVALMQQGIALFDAVAAPSSTDAEPVIVSIANRLGSITRTWYGDKIFTVRSTANSKNIAYTSLPLDLHMDLLHFDDPPRYQLLHCLQLDKNLKGGVSYFVDSYRAAERLKKADRASYEILCSESITFEYKNDGHWTQALRPTIQLGSEGRIEAINYSPPFQGPLKLHASSGSSADATNRILAIHSALRSFRAILDDPALRFEIQLLPGQCVAFDNRRVLHARTGFSTSDKQTTDDIRLLHGCYVDETAVKDKYRVLSEEVGFD